MKGRKSNIGWDSAGWLIISIIALVIILYAIFVMKTGTWNVLDMIKEGLG